MADLRDHAVQYKSFLDSLHGVSCSPLTASGFFELHHFMGDQISGDEGLGCGPDTEWLDCIILQSTLATSIVAYLESVPWESLTPDGLCELDTSFLLVLQACDILGKLLTGAVSDAGRSSLRGALLVKQVYHHPLSLSYHHKISVITGVMLLCVQFQNIHSAILQMNSHSYLWLTFFALLEHDEETCEFTLHNIFSSH